jgi:hypothetical protein
MVRVEVDIQNSRNLRVWLSFQEKLLVHKNTSAAVFLFGHTFNVVIQSLNTATMVGAMVFCKELGFAVWATFEATPLCMAWLLGKFASAHEYIKVNVLVVVTVVTISFIE